MKRRTKVFLVISAALAAAVFIALATGLLLPRYGAERPWSSAAADTTGSARVESGDWPIAAEAGDERPKIETVFTVGEHGVVEGGAFRVSLGWLLPTEQKLYTPFSLTVSSAFFFEINLLKDADATSSADVKLVVEEPVPAAHFQRIVQYLKYKRTSGAESRDNLMRQIDNEFGVKIRVARGELKPGDEVRLVLGATDGLEPPPREAQWQVVWAVDGDADGEFGLPDDAPWFAARSRSTRAVRVIAPTVMRPGDTSSVTLRTEDDYFLPNLTAFETASVTFEEVEGVEVPRRVSFGAAGSRDASDPLFAWDESIAQFDVTASSPGVYRLMGVATVDGEEFRVLSNPIVVDEEAPHVYFGDTHLHSILSYDADRPPEYVYWRQKFQERHDFATLTDHDMIGNPGFIDLRGLQGRTPDEWEYIIELADRWNAPGEFVTLRAHEWTSYYYGHRNVYYAPDEVDPEMAPHHRTSREAPFDSQTPDELRGALEGADAIVIPHSTAWPTSSVTYHWGDPKTFDAQRLLEIYSTHGASEYFDNEYAVDEGRPEAPTESWLVRKLMNYDIRQAPAESGNFGRDALAAGWRFGFLGSSDMHFLSHLDQAYRYGFAAVVADELTRPAIWEAMKSRRTYATTGVRIYLRFDANGAPMGSVIEARAPLQLRVVVEGTDALDRVQIVRYDGDAYGLLLDREIGSDAGFFDTVTDEEATAGMFYYLKVRQEDGHYAWSSPIWLEEP